MRQIILDTETTGLEPELGHRIIEIGCVEVLHRRVTGRTFHRYVNPEREIEQGAEAVHGISRVELEGKPRFAEIAQELLAFISGAELVIHNAAFDVAFLDHELSRLPAGGPVAPAGAPTQGVAPTQAAAVGQATAPPTIGSLCTVLDSLALARELHPGQRNNLDALCKRYGVDNSRRELHGALLDAQILADVYLAMTGGQAALALGDAAIVRSSDGARLVRALVRPPVPLRIVVASEEELQAHELMLGIIAKASGGRCLWQHGAEMAEKNVSRG
jgi:DNA polymerase III subunit epsilon